MIQPNEILIAEKVGSYYASRWKQVEKDDLIQHLILWMAERDSNQMQRWRDEDSIEGKLYVSLKRAANDYCRAETSKVVHQELTANNSYTLEVVKRTLPFVFSTPSVEDPINSKALMIVGDVSSALFALSKDDIEIITLRYRDEYTHEELASHYGVMIDTASQRLHRATERVLSKLGGVAVWDWSGVGKGGHDDL
jgi:RNA polymerase sigma factor (sigma-70 family)